MENFFLLDDLVLPAPYPCTYQLIDLSSDKSGRNPLTGDDYKDIVAQKRKLVCKWNAMPVQKASELAQKMKMRGVTVQLTFFDIVECGYIVKTFTTGDFSGDYMQGWSKRKWINNISCDFVEK